MAEAITEYQAPLPEQSGPIRLLVGVQPALMVTIGDTGAGRHAALRCVHPQFRKSPNAGNASASDSLL